MDRRHFFHTSFWALAAGLVGSSCAVNVPTSSSRSSAGKGYAFIALHNGNGQSTLRKLNLDNWEFEDTLIPIGVPHAVLRPSQDYNSYFVFDFEGEAVKINGQTNETIKCSDGLFLGHAFYDHEEEIIWCTERVKGNDIVRARRASDWKILEGKNFSFPGGHHVTRLPGSSLLVSSGSIGDRHHVTFFDFRKKEISKTVPCDYPGVHTLPLSGKEIVTVTTQVKMDKTQLAKMNRLLNPASRASMKPEELTFAGYSPLIYANTDGQVRNYWDTSRKELFQLGLGIDRVKSGETFLTSHTSSNTIIVWKDFQVQKVISAPNPLVIIATNDGKSVVAHSEGKLRMYSLETGALEKEIAYERQIMTLSKY